MSKHAHPYAKRVGAVKNGPQVKSGHTGFQTTPVGSSNAQTERVGGGRYKKR